MERLGFNHDKCSGNLSREALCLSVGAGLGYCSTQDVCFLSRLSFIDLFSVLTFSIASFNVLERLRLLCDCDKFGSDGEGGVAMLLVRECLQSFGCSIEWAKKCHNLIRFKIQMGLIRLKVWQFSNSLLHYKMLRLLSDLIDVAVTFKLIII